MAGLDPVVPPVRIVQYYEKVESVMGLTRTRDFARLFMAPGMNHCGGGRALIRQDEEEHNKGDDFET